MSFRKLRRQLTTSRALPSHAYRDLDKVYDLIDEKKWATARLKLEQLNERHPNNIEILAALAQTYYYLHEHSLYLGLCIRLTQLEPNDPHNFLALASSYLFHGRPVLAYRTFQHVLTKWPECDDAEGARDTVQKLEVGLVKILEEMKLFSDEGMELAALHEQSQVFMEQGDYAKGIAKAEELLALHPNFPSALNNISVMKFAQGDIAGAIAASEQVLSFAPDNFHALSNLTRYLLAIGRTEEGRQHAEKLKTVDTLFTDRWVKQAEAFSALGDDEEVLATFRQAQEQDKVDPSFNTAFFYHLAACASARLGNEQEAQELWKSALAANPTFDLAKENLADLRKPAGERNGPWAFHYGHWISVQARKDVKLLGQKKGRHTDPVQEYLKKHPELFHIVPLMLDRGDLHGREFAIRFAAIAQTPELLKMVRDFALGPKGSDKLRFEAARIAQEHDLIPSGEVKFWNKGVLADVLILNMEIKTQPENKLNPKAIRLYSKAYELLADGDGVSAERILKQALEIAPDSPTLLNNLAAAYEQQGRKHEFRQLVLQIYEKHPDYLFGCINRAKLYVHEKEYDKAGELLRPLLKRKQMHITELCALCEGFILFYYKQGNRDAARSWLGMLEQNDPDHRGIEHWKAKLNPQAKLEGPDLMKALQRLLR